MKLAFMVDFFMYLRYFVSNPTKNLIVFVLFFFLSGFLFYEILIHGPNNENRSALRTFLKISLKSATNN